MLVRDTHHEGTPHALKIEHMLGAEVKSLLDRSGTCVWDAICVYRLEPAKTQKGTFKDKWSPYMLLTSDGA